MPFLRLLVILSVSIGLAACAPQKPQFHGVDITGADYARGFSLTDPSGKPRTLADFAGKVVVVFFGYTQCPDVCPTTMSDMAEAIKKMGSKGDRVEVLFVTIDPDRDTPEVLKAYAPAFGPQFLGLYGNAAATAAVAREFKVFYQKVPGPTPSTYSMDHSAGSYVFDPTGHVRLYLRYDEKPDDVASDLLALL